MKEIKSKEAKSMINKIDKGILESKKWRVKQIAKSILIGLFTIVIFPFILLWMFITDKD